MKTIFLGSADKPKEIPCLKCGQHTDRGWVVTWPHGGVICPKCFK